MKHPSKFRLSQNNRQLLINSSAALLILLFLYAALTKLMVYREFIIQLANSPLLEDYAGILAWLLPTTEIAICILLIFIRIRWIGFVLSFMLMLTFTAYVIYVITYAPYIPCACGGVLNSMSWSSHLIFNLVYTAIALTGLLLHQKIRSCERSG